MDNVKYGLSTCIGETIVGLPFPVFYDTHYPIRVNKPPVTLITGSPGSGKTFLSLLIAAHASLLNKVGFVIDWKGDFVALKTLEREGYINNVRLWNLVSDKGEVDIENTGILDPTLFTDRPSDNAALTMDVIKILCGEITPTQASTLTPIINDITVSSQPSFEKVVSKLVSNRNDEIRSLGFTLETILKTELAKLLVTNKRIKRKPLQIKNEFIVMNLKGMSLPDDKKSTKEYSYQEKISIVILSLISQIILNAMKNMPTDIYKTLIVDEAWGLLMTKIGRSMVSEAARIGRALNLGIVLSTQSGKHFNKNKDFDTLISERFAFANNDEEDNANTIRTMRLPIDEGWESQLRELKTGECLLQNSQYETSLIQIMADDDWVDLFDTTPTSDET